MPEELNAQLALPGLSPDGEPRALDQRRVGNGEPVPINPRAAGSRRRRVPAQRDLDEDRLADRIADRVAARLRAAPGASSGQLIDAAEVARILGCARGWVYEHKAELGVVRLGGGRRPRLRFDRGRVIAVAAAQTPSEPAPEPRRASQRRARRGRPLLEIRGRAP